MRTNPGQAEDRKRTCKRPHRQKVQLYRIFQHFCNHIMVKMLKNAVAMDYLMLQQAHVQNLISMDHFASDASVLWQSSKQTRARNSCPIPNPNLFFIPVPTLLKALWFEYTLLTMKLHYPYSLAIIVIITYILVRLYFNLYFTLFI